MGLIALAVFDTLDNGRTELTRRTLESLKETVDWSRHCLVISDNGSCQATHDLYRELFGERATFMGRVEIIFNETNIGTARAINKAWSWREPNWVAVKMDNDVVIHQAGWLDEIEEVFRRDPTIGICGLKRKDLEERPDHPNPWFVSRLRMLPHQLGERWIVVEEVNHVMGTCQAYSPALLERIGYLYQMQDEGNRYGYDDALASVRAHLAGFKTVFLPHIPIDHIDPGGCDFTAWKQANAGVWQGRYFQVREEYRSGKRPLYYEDPR